MITDQAGDRNGGARFVMVTGASPGLGKSTVTSGLGGHLAANGREVVVFLEAMIGERDEFAEVMASFRANAAVSRAVLMEATRRFADTYRECSAVVVQDMLLPYTPSLLAWGFSDAEIIEMFDEIAAACSGIDLIQLHLDGSPAASLPRAVEREDPSWLDWMTAKISKYADVATPVTGLGSLVEYFDRARMRTLKLLAEAPWPVVIIDADRGRDQTLDDAISAVVH